MGEKLKPEINKYKNQLIDFLTEFKIARGQSPKIATISSYLSIYESLTQQELDELTNFSMGSISTNLNIMHNMGLVTKNFTKGKRKRIFSYSLSETFHSLFERGISLRLKYASEFIEFIELKENELQNYLDCKRARELKENIREIKIYLEKFKIVLSKFKDVPIL